MAVLGEELADRDIALGGGHRLGGGSPADGLTDGGAVGRVRGGRPLVGDFNLGVRFSQDGLLERNVAQASSLPESQAGLAKDAGSGEPRSAWLDNVGPSSSARRVKLWRLYRSCRKPPSEVWRRRRHERLGGRQPRLRQTKAHLLCHQWPKLP